ncbi:MAG: PqqD family protein [Thermoanaerobaculia bacterium]
MTTLRGIRSALASGRFTQKKLADGSGALLDVDGMQVIRLNRTAMFLLEEIQKGASATTDLVNSLTASFEVESEEAQRDVKSLLEDLGRHLSQS